MKTATARVKPPKGRTQPRLSPPSPAISGVKDYIRIAEDIGIELMEWQKLAARYIEARGRDKRLLFRECAVIVSRQNGKTELLIPLIVKRMLEGRRIMHTAQDRSLPREIFYRVADILYADHQKLFPTRNGRSTKPRYANGQEEIRLTNGGVYSLVAPSRGGARGPTRDLVIVDELREMEDWNFIAAAKPTLTVSPDPQIIYLSNAGSEDSVVLNALRLRGQSDPALAYLEWSAAPERAVDDITGWSESNPAMGHEPSGMGSVYETLLNEFRTSKIEGTLSIFETEHLCRWVATMRERLVDDFSWVRCKADEPQLPNRPVLGVSMDPKGRRVSAALAWQDGKEVRLQLVLNEVGEPFDTDAAGRQIKQLVEAHKVRGVVYDPLTDVELVKYVRLPKPEPVSGQKFANASAQFRNGVDAMMVRWQDGDAITDDLTWTAMKLDGEGAYHATRAIDDRPITAALAAIRAVWKASGPATPTARVWT